MDRTQTYYTFYLFGNMEVAKLLMTKLGLEQMERLIGHSTLSRRVHRRRNASCTCCSSTRTCRVSAVGMARCQVQSQVDILKQQHTVKLVVPVCALGGTSSPHEHACVFVYCCNFIAPFQVPSSHRACGLSFRLTCLLKSSSRTADFAAFSNMCARLGERRL